MASNKQALAICDTCGFRYPHRVMKLNSYGLLVCPEDYEGAYDLKNNPQNKAPDVKDNEAIRNARPPSNKERNLLWENASSIWNETTQEWNRI